MLGDVWAALGVNGLVWWDSEGLRGRGRPQDRAGGGLTLGGG